MLPYHRKLLSGVDQGSGAATESTKLVVKRGDATPTFYVYDIDPSSGFTGGPRSPSGGGVPAGQMFGGITMEDDWIAATGINNTVNSGVWFDTGSAINYLSGATGLQSLPGTNGLSGGCKFLTIGGDRVGGLLINTGSSSGIVSYTRSGDVFTSVGTVGGNANATIGVHADVLKEYITQLGTIDSSDGDGTLTSYATSFPSIPSNASGAVSTLTGGGARYAAWAGNSTVEFYNVTTGTPSLMSKSGIMTNACRGAAFNPQNPEQCVIVGDGAPYAQIVELVGSTWTAVSSPFDTAPTASCRGCGWSKNGAMVGITQEASPYVLLYAMSGTSATKFADPGTLPSGTPVTESFSFN